MPKILLLTLDFPPRTGGVARYLGALTDFFKEEISVISVPEKGDEEFDQKVNYLVRRQELLSKIIWPHWLKTAWLLLKEKNNYQILIVSHLLPLGTAAWLAKIFTGRPYIVIVHGMDVALAKQSVIKKQLAGFVLSEAKVVVANSTALAEEVKKDFDVKKTEVVCPGIKNFPHNNVDRRYCDPGHFVLLTVSRLVPRKGHSRVLEAVVALKDRIPNLHYKIVGDGPMKEILKKKVDELDLSSFVEFLDNVSNEEFAEIYSSSDLFVMPTVANQADREGFGTVYLEAAAYGVPSIATRQPGVDEAVVDGETGILVADGNIDELAAAIFDLWQDLEKLKHLGLTAQQRAVLEFGWGRQMEKLRKYL